MRYRDALSVLDIPEIIEAHDLSLEMIECCADDPESDLGDWAGHGPALSVYTMWAVYALKERGVIGAEDADSRLTRVAELQRVIHYRRTAGWLAPSWWGSDVHRQHRVALIAKDRSRYTLEGFRR